MRANSRSCARSSDGGTARSTLGAIATRSRLGGGAFLRVARRLSRATALFVASLALRWSARGAAATPRAPFVLSALGVAVLGVAGYLGGLVDYEYAATTRRRSPDVR